MFDMSSPGSVAERPALRPAVRVRAPGRFFINFFTLSILSFVYADVPSSILAASNQILRARPDRTRKQMSGQITH